MICVSMTDSVCGLGRIPLGDRRTLVLSAGAPARGAPREQQLVFGEVEYSASLELTTTMHMAMAMTSTTAHCTAPAKSRVYRAGAGALALPLPAGATAILGCDLRQHDRQCLSVNGYVFLWRPYQKSCLLSAGARAHSVPRGSALIFGKLRSPRARP